VGQALELLEVVNGALQNGGLGGSRVLYFWEQVLEEGNLLVDLLAPPPLGVIVLVLSLLV